MFSGDYSFFDYKYNIVGYSGQDYGGVAQYIYLIGSIILLIFLLIIFRKISKGKVLKIIRIITIFLLLLDVFKITWESIYDIQKFGAFNTGLLPLDTCSIIIFAGIISSFSKGKIKEYSDAWLVTGSIVGGIGNMFYLSALNYYPFFTFGAFYSMIWHFLMVFVGLLMIVTNYVPIKYKTVLKGTLFHAAVSLIVIPIDFIFDFDFMMYKNLGSIPIFENVASFFTINGCQVLNPIMMFILYFLAFNIVFGLPIITKKITGKYLK